MKNFIKNLASLVERAPLDHPLTIAVDFDGCLFENRWPDIGEPNEPLIECLKQLEQSGKAELILWSCREGARLSEAVAACERQDLKFVAINENSPRLIELWGTDPRKVGADLYIDDRALRCEAVWRH